jgi:diguanylate cyclase (GGDEF)-like protein/PAS domain S-box-containing protein
MNGSDVYTAGFSETEKLAQYWSAQIPIHFAGQEFSLRVWPNHQYIIDHISWLPEITFIIGLVITLLTTVLLYLWGMLRRNNFYLARQVSNRTEDLAESEHRYHLLYENSPDLQMSVSITDRSIMQCNQSLVTALKCHSKDEIIGKDLLSIFHSTSHELLVKAYNDLQKEYKSCNVELSLLNPDGSKMPNMVRMSVIRNFYGRIICTMISCKDISEKKALEKLDSMAHYDRATKLPNKNYFQDFLARAFERATRSKKCFAILYIDLDHFKNINDSFGHDTGDLLLVKAAERIHSVVRKDHFLARIGGDEFAIISEELSKPQQAGILADRIVRVFNNRMRLDHRVLNISVSIGIAVYPFAGETIETLLRSADIAMYKAKESGRNNYHYYTSTLHKTHLRTLQIDQALRGAIRNKEFYLNFQPIYDIRTQAVSSVETLIRWRQNKMGHVSPAEFFPIAEENGVIYELSEWLFESVCIQMSAWRKKWPNLKFKVAINCSVLQLEQTDFMTLIESRIEKYGLRYDDFILELTETMLMQQIKNTAFMLKKLSARGIKVAIDDFGTGYSSLNYLKSLPISIIKIDKSFIHDILEDTDAQTIVEAIINLGKTLKIDVIAEGVEKEEQLQLLRKLGCHFIQGFLMSKPMRLEMMENFLHQQQQHQEGQKTVSAA